MNDVIVVEAADDVEDGVGLADVCEEFVAEAFAFAGAFYEAGDVGDFDGCGHHGAGFADVHEGLYAVIGHGDDAYVGFDGAEGEVGRLCLGVAKAVEEC